MRSDLVWGILVLLGLVCVSVFDLLRVIVIWNVPVTLVHVVVLIDR